MVLRAVVLVFCQNSGDAFQEASDIWQEYREKDSRKIFLNGCQATHRNTMIRNSTYQVEFIRSFIRLANECLDKENASDKSSKNHGADENKRNDNQLSHDPLPPRKNVLHSSSRVNDFFLVTELWAVQF